MDISCCRTTSLSTRGSAAQRSYGPRSNVFATVPLRAAFDLLYVHSPDRLARKYAYQVLLLDELRRCGVTAVFIHGPAGQTAEDELLVQVQGMIAEYERAKILERCRRGKLHRARLGSVNPMSGAPYGFAYIKKSDEAPATGNAMAILVS